MPASLFLQLNVGKTGASNRGFPETKLLKGFFMGVGWHHRYGDREWARQLRGPSTGLMLGITDFGNKDKVGYATTIMPYLELNPFSGQNTLWKLRTGLGFSYFNKQFDPVDNPFNRAVSTKFKWSFRSLLYYDLSSFERTTWRVGLGFIHYSNGHTSLPNQGLNAVMASLEADFNRGRNTVPVGSYIADSIKTRTVQNYLSLRAGVGQNVLSEKFNDKKEVYTLALSYGKVINSTFKFGFGAFYRVYEHYYDYIEGNGALVADAYPYFRDKPFVYASNYGITGSAELLMGHVGAEFNIGFNIHKPAYKIDWQLNKGYSFQSGDETVIVLGVLDAYYEIKRSIPTRMGLKWYFINTKKSPHHNVFLGAHINANLGQADFTELSLGYVARFKLKTRPLKI